MIILDSTSLMNTLDNINEKYLFGEAISKEEGLKAAQWIISQQGKKGAYRNMFAPTPSDFEQGPDYLQVKGWFLPAPGISWARKRHVRPGY